MVQPKEKGVTHGSLGHANNTTITNAPPKRPAEDRLDDTAVKALQRFKSQIKLWAVEEMTY
jgi:hypothetical protein